MSYWTQLHAAFKLSVPNPMNVDLMDDREPDEKDYNLIREALVKIGLMNSDEKLLNIYSCVANPCLSDVVLNLKATTRDWDEHKGTFLPSFDIRTEKSSLYCPLLPMTPTGSEGPPKVLTAYNDDTDTLMVNVIGSLRDVEPSYAPYIIFWLKCVSVICETEVLYTYENFDERKTGLIDPYELPTEDKVDVLCTYFNTFRKWYDEKKNKGTISWLNFVIQSL